MWSLGVAEKMHDLHVYRLWPLIHKHFEEKIRRFWHRDKAVHSPLCILHAILSQNCQLHVHN